MRLLRLFGRSLSRRLALLFAVILLPPTVISLYFAWDAFAEHKARASLQVRQLATLAATYERKFFEDMRQVLQRLSNQPALQRPRPARCRETLIEALESVPEVAGLVLYDTTGQPICGTSETPVPVDGRPWFRDIQTYRSFTISDYTFTPESRYPVIVAALAVRDSAGEFKGVLAAAIELFWLTAFMRDAALPPDSVFFLLDSNGNVLADRSLGLDNANPGLPKDASGPRGANQLRSIVKPDVIQEIVTQRLVDFEAVGNDGVRRVYSSVAMPHGNVVVLFGVPAATALGWLEKDLLTRVLSLAAMWLTGIGAAWLGTRYLVTRWTGALRRVALAYGRGERPGRLDLTDAPSELRDLGDTMIHMVERIEARERELRRSLEQKEVLLREIHHRVKNNLQIVTSLLNIHGKSVSNLQAREALDEVKTRVRALSLVHRYLYEGDDVRLVDLRAFMTELCRTMMHGLTDAQRRVSLDMDMPKFMVSSEKAIPIALMVTEAMTNALKHAFPDGRSGTIRVEIRPEGPGTATIVIADDGVGLSAESESRDGLGLGMIRAFARQIGGDMTVSGPPGTAIEVRIDTHGFQDAEDGAGGRADPNARSERRAAG